MSRYQVKVLQPIHRKIPQRERQKDRQTETERHMQKQRQIIRERQNGGAPPPPSCYGSLTRVWRNAVADAADSEACDRVTCAPHM